MHEKPRSCKAIADIEVGDRIELPYIVTEDDVHKFACLSGDWNPVHFDDDYARGTIFKKRIAHGVLSLAKFSGIFGMDLPGLGTLWEAQEVKFCGPVFLNEPYKAVAEVESLDRRRVVLSTWVEDNNGNKVLEGKATVIPISATTKAKLGWPR